MKDKQQARGYPTACVYVCSGVFALICKRVAGIGLNDPFLLKGATKNNVCSVIIFYSVFVATIYLMLRMQNYLF